MADRWRQLHEEFRWQVPSHFNIAEVCGRRWAGDKSRIAIKIDADNANGVVYTFAALSADANRLSNVLRHLGVQRGDKVAIVLPQRAETAICHLAIYQLGAIAVPLSVLFGPDALAYRLQDSQAKIAITDPISCARIVEVQPTCEHLRHVLGVETTDTPLQWNDLLAKASDRFEPIRTAAYDPAAILYTSGTTGSPKGALLPHAALVGNLPGFVASQAWFPQSGDVFWSPADWAWTGGLMDALLPTLYFGFPIVAHRGRFDPESALAMMARQGVSNTFLFPTALKMLMKQVRMPLTRHRLRLRSIMSAGEPLSPAVFDWAKEAFGFPINEMFGQTEANYLIGNASSEWPAIAGAMGRPYPGHRVAIVSDAGEVMPDGEIGNIAVHRRDHVGDRDPVFFLGYLNDQRATSSKFTSPTEDAWLLTGDLGRKDSQDTFWYEGRADDLFKSAGYRIAPVEIENCLLSHEAVANVAIVPSPDAERGSIVKAFVVLAERYEASDELVEALQHHVRYRLAPYEYPKVIEFVAALPMTTTGKIQRRILRDLENQRGDQA